MGRSLTGSADYRAAIDEPVVINLADAPAIGAPRGATFIKLEPDGVTWPDTGLNVQVMRPGEAGRPLPLRTGAGGLPRPLRGVRRDRRGRGARAAPVGLSPLPGRGPRTPSWARGTGPAPCS